MDPSWVINHDKSAWCSHDFPMIFLEFSHDIIISLGAQSPWTQLLAAWAPGQSAWKDSAKPWGGRVKHIEELKGKVIGNSRYSIMNSMRTSMINCVKIYSGRSMKIIPLISKDGDSTFYTTIIGDSTLGFKAFNSPNMINQWGIFVELTVMITNFHFIEKMVQHCGTIYIHI